MKNSLYSQIYCLTLTLLNATECTNSKRLLQIVALSRQGIFARLTHSVAFSRRGVCYTTWILLRNSRIPNCILLHLARFMFRNTAGLTPLLRRPCIHAIFFPTTCRTACKHAFCFLRVRPEAMSTRHSWLWQTLDDVYTRRCFSES